MSASPLPAQDRSVQDSLAFLELVFRDVDKHDFAIRLWDGRTMMPTDGRPARFTLVIQHPGALRRMFESATELSLGEAYIYNDYDIEGDIEMAARVGQQLAAYERPLRERLRLRALLRTLPNMRPSPCRRVSRLQGELHSKTRDRNVVRYHYDVSNDFYALFLGRTMVYSDAYFVTPEDDLDKAQTRKLENICRGLKLQKGERFLDIGCGWGALILHAAQNFGVEALGITLSERQAELARKRIQNAGLERCCRVEVRDYRDLDGITFDKVASIGMMEHVGAENLHGYFGRIRRLLRPGGIFFNSSIVRPMTEPARRTGSFVEAYVFPDGELEPLHEILEAAEMAGFEVCSTENTREHYGLTLRHWLRRLESSADDARCITDDLTYRIWRLYMAGSAARFMDGKLHAFQSLLAKTDGGPAA
jgi:cyclopropane-fatty-acyl-phospholipid synthase